MSPDWHLMEDEHDTSLKVPGVSAAAFQCKLIPAFLSFPPPPGWGSLYDAVPSLLACSCWWMSHRSCGSSFALQHSELKVLLIYCNEELRTQFRRQTKKKKKTIVQDQKVNGELGNLKSWYCCVSLVSYSILEHWHLWDDGKRAGPRDGGQWGGCPDQSTRADWRQQATMA